ncbi:MAG: serine/threonine-protein kinase [Burkholderiales bacterium]|nr:serine/threonine-protein kinase [Burkholderiales bacterium]
MSGLTDTQSISKRLTRYKIIRELGRGASGKVYLGEDPFAKRKVAIKVLFSEGGQASPEDAALYKSMFINEASLAGKLVHPHITQILDAVVEDSFSYIVMEYVEGGTLEQYTNPNNLLKPGQVVEIIFKSVRALAYAHSLGLTHRDIKPGNILLSSGTNIKIADFGAAINRISDKTIVTQVGSPAYMAPELIRGDAQASHRTDIYSLGVVMFYLLAGRLPYQASNPASLTYMMVNTDPDPPSTVRPGVAAELDAIVLKAMARNPAERYQAWEDFGLALTDIWAKELSSQEERDESDSARFAVLKTLPFFKNFPENELWEVLRISKWRKLPAGTVIIKEGDRGDSFFILAGGYCKVTRGNKTLSALAAGDCLGEMSYLGQKEERSATVTTTSECLVMKVRAEDLTTASPLCKHHFDRQFLKVLVARLDNANQQISVLS